MPLKQSFLCYVTKKLFSTANVIRPLVSDGKKTTLPSPAHLLQVATEDGISPDASQSCSSCSESRLARRNEREGNPGQTWYLLNSCCRILFPFLEGKLWELLGSSSIPQLAGALRQGTFWGPTLHTSHMLVRLPAQVSAPQPICLQSQQATDKN